MQPLFFQSLRLLLTDYSPPQTRSPFLLFPLLFFAPPSASQTPCQRIEQEICVSSALALFRVFLHLRSTTLQTFRQWSEGEQEEEEEDHGCVHALLLPPLSVF